MPYSKKEKRRLIKEMDKAIKKTKLKVEGMKEMDGFNEKKINQELDGLKAKTDDEELKKKIESIRKRLTG